jgi:ADP-heptose:LPS heptosyltransferase
VAGFVLRIDHSLDKNFKTIVVSKYVGMGSIIQATPLLQTLRKNYPQAHIIFLSRASNKSLLRHFPFIDEVITIEDENFFTLFRSTLKALIRLWKHNPGVLIDLEVYSHFSAIISSLSLAKNRLGFIKNENNYRRGLFTHKVYFNQKSLISEAYLRFAELLGCRDLSRDLYRIILSEELKTSESYLKKAGISIREKYIVINPNASDLRIERRWPAEKFIAFILELLERKPGHKIVLTGSTAEESYVNSITSAIENSRLINTCGKLDLEGLISLIDNAEVLVSNDTGPMHLGYAQQKKTVALFGPADPEQFTKNGEEYVIYKNVACSPCVHTFLTPPCKGNNRCMKDIEVEEVLNIVEYALKANTSVHD